MTTTATPPPPPASAPAPGTARPNSALRGILLLIGSILLIGMLVSAGLRIVQLAGFEDHSGTHQVTEAVDSVLLDTSAADVVVQYGDVTHPQIDFDQARDDQVMRYGVRNGELRVDVDQRRGFWFFGPSIGWGSRGSELTLTLPTGATGMDLSLNTTAGDLQAHGDFGALDIDMTAGQMLLSGGAESVQVDSTAASLRAEDFAVTGPVGVDITAGDLHFEAADLPSAIDVTSTAAGVRFELPAGEYEIRTDSTAGGVNQGVASTPGADRVYTFDSTAGEVVLVERP